MNGAKRRNEMLACASPNELGRQGDEDDCHHAQQGHLQPEVLGKSNFGGEVRTHVHHLPKLFSLYLRCRASLMRVKWTAPLSDMHGVVKFFFRICGREVET